MDFDTFKRFMTKVDVTDDCWNWIGQKTVDGYGILTFTNKKIKKKKYVHRLSYEHYKQEIPPKMTIDHLCRNRRCVNPDHLECVTNVENVMRGQGITVVNKAKTHCDNGHEFSSENTYVTSKGYRQCQICKRFAKARSRLKSRSVGQ